MKHPDFTQFPAYININGNSRLHKYKLHILKHPAFTKYPVYIREVMHINQKIENAHNCDCFEKPIWARLYYLNRIQSKCHIGDVI